MHGVPADPMRRSKPHLNLVPWKDDYVLPLQRSYADQLLKTAVEKVVAHCANIVLLSTKSDRLQESVITAAGISFYVAKEDHNPM